MTPPNYHHQSGFVLITGLILILVVTIVTVSSMQSTNLDYKISSNEAFKDIAFQSSESGRTAAGVGISDYLESRSFTGITGLSHDSDYDPYSDLVASGEDLLDTSSLTVDLEFNLSATDIEDIEADINVLKAPAVSAKKSALQQLSGYEGLGKSAAEGGTHIIFEIRSTGYGPSRAAAVTASEFKVIP